VDHSPYLLFIRQDHVLLTHLYTTGLIALVCSI
jgi:hypothetical protein